jgi:hypothetical protein
LIVLKVQLETKRVEDNTYIPSPRASTHGKGKGIAGASGSGATRDDIEEESEGGADIDGDEEKCVDVFCTGKLWGGLANYEA